MYGLKQPSPPSSPKAPIPVRIGDGSQFGPLPVCGIGAFGDVVTAPLTPRVQTDFVYGGNEDMVDEFTAGLGTISYANGMAAMRSNGLGVARLTTKHVVRYRPGQGALFRWTGLYDTPDADAEQLTGAFSCSTNALVFGYNGLDFGFLRRHSGAVEVQALQITTAATGAETVSITLNGVLHTVPVTSGTVEETAQEIAEGTYTGWVAEATGDTVHFMSQTAGVKAGTYLISSTGAADGTYTELWAGAAAGDDWHTQSSWSVDRFDGSGPSGCVLDPTKGNVFAVSLQYLGFGGIKLYIEDPETTLFQHVHTIEWANANTATNVTNPTFHLGACVSSTDTGPDKTVKTASLAGFVEGERKILGSFHGWPVVGTATGGGVSTPVLSIRNTNIYPSGAAQTNLRDLIPAIITASTTGSNKPVRISVFINGTLTDPLWNYFNGGGHSIANIDTSATAITGGDFVASIADGQLLYLTPEDIAIVPGDMISLVITPSGTAADYEGSISWREDV